MIRRLRGKFRFIVVLGIVLVVSSCQKAPEEKLLSPGVARSVKKSFSALPEEAFVSDPPSPQGGNTVSMEALDPVAEVVSADLSPGETCSRLLAVLPSTPAGDHPFLFQLAGNYCPDVEYWRLLPFLLDRNQPETCREELMRDVLRRPDTVRLRPLYRLAIDPTHPLSAEAKDYLFSYLQDVPENDLSALGRAVEKREREVRGKPD